jgi:biotin carboxyl carrier protein
MYTTYTQITPPIHLRRSRTLPVSGTVLVRLGQKVAADDVIAEATVATHHEMVDVVRLLGLSGTKAAEDLITRKSGEVLSEHDIIAETGGMFSRIVRTPAPGKIISIRNGQVLIETETRKIELVAHYSGVISEVIANRGAVIETSGSLIQGAWGNGKFGEGRLILQAENAETSLSSAKFDITSRGGIIAAGTLLEEKVFDIAAALPINGLILGSMPVSLVEKALSQPYPVLLIDGFGKSGTNHAAFKYLSMYNSHEITVNAEFDSDASGIKPEALISASVENESSRDQKKVSAGQVVRIHTTPFLGQMGTIEKVLPGLTLLPNGLRVSAVTVVMENKERKTVPVDNLDMIGFAQSNLS